MTYNVFGGTLSLAQSINHVNTVCCLYQFVLLIIVEIWQLIIFCADIIIRSSCLLSRRVSTVCLVVSLSLPALMR